MSEQQNSHLGHGLQLEQKQGLTLTPALAQALQILAMPALELTDFIHAQLEENPAFELVEQAAESNASPDEEPPVYEAAGETWEQLLELGEEAPYYSQPAASDYPEPLFVAPEEEELSSFLRMQLATHRASPVQKALAESLIPHLDENGYLAQPLPELAEEAGLPLASLEEALTLLQSLEPAGVAARDLRECLSLQVPETLADRQLILAIIAEHLEDLARERVKETAKALSCNQQAVERAFAYVRGLNPRPAAGLQESMPQVQYIVPDIIVRKIGETYQVILNERLEPKVRVSSYYRRLDKQVRDDTATRDYLRQKLAAAVALIRNLEKRRTTIYRLACLVVEHQRDFLDVGLSGLKPLTMRDLAEEAELHESTVSRTIAGKYVQTPRGVYPWKFFFPRAYDTASGKVAPAWAKAQLAELVAAENKANPYSDEQLRALLVERGLVLARRTVAKYREELRIPPRFLRRRK